MKRTPKAETSRLYRIFGAMLFAVLLTTIGCGDDFGTECALPDNDVVRDACSSSNSDINQSCIVENIIQCDSRVCGVFRGSAGFCTKPCTGEDDTTSCPSNAFCAEYVVGTGEFFCVKNELAGR